MCKIINNINKRIFVIFLSFICILFFSIHINASENNVDDKVSIMLKSKIGVSSYSLYRIADYSEMGEFTFVEPFSDYSLSVDNLDNEGWRALASTLSGYIERDDLQPLDIKKTDNQGFLTWENISKGLYLIVGEIKLDDQYIYTPMPVLVTVPNLETNGEWNNQPIVCPKYNKDLIETDKTVDHTVTKIWDDKENEQYRPKTIEVQLLKNGEIYDTVTLNENNNWEHTWKNLSMKFQWNVVEKKVPDNYTGTSIQENNDFIITNTYHNRSVNVNDNKENANDKETHINNHDETINQEKLPFTGQIWWPVPLFIGVGLLMIGYGMKQSNK